MQKITISAERLANTKFNPREWREKLAAQFGVEENEIGVLASFDRVGLLTEVSVILPDSIDSDDFKTFFKALETEKDERDEVDAAPTLEERVKALESKVAVLEGKK